MKNYILILILALGLPLATYSQNFKVIKSGKGGNTSGQMLRRINSDVLSHNPTTTILLAGTNDFLNIPKLTSIEDYESNLRTIIDKIQNNGSDVIIMTIPTIIESIWVKDKTDRELRLFEPEGPEGKVVLGNRVVSRIASQKGIALVDTYTLFKNNLNFLSRDGVHQTDAGSRAMSRLLRDAIIANGFSINKMVLLGDSITNRYDDIFIQYLKDNPIGTPPPPTDGNTVHMRKRNASGFAIDGGNGGAKGQNIYLYNSKTSNRNQQWNEINRGNGFYSYQKKGTNFCIDGGNGGANGQNVYLWTCGKNNQNQHWKKVNRGSGNFRLEKRNAPGFSIDGGRKGANRQNLYLWASNNANQNQQWSFGNAREASNSLERNTEIHTNPTTGVLNIDINEVKAANVSIYNIIGQKISEQEIKTGSNTIALDDLDAGVYIIKINHEGETLVKKIMND